MPSSRERAASAVFLQIGVCFGFSVIAGFWLGAYERPQPVWEYHTNSVGSRALARRLDDGKLCSSLYRRGELADLNRFLSEFGRRDPKGALLWASSLKADAKSAAHIAILSGWMLNDPSSAFVWAKENCPTFFLSQEFIDAAVKLKNINLALAGAQAVPNGDQRGTVAFMLFDAFGKQTEPNTLFALTRDLDPVMREASMRALIPKIAAKDIDSACSNITDSSYSPQLKYQLSKAAFDSWLSANPGSALDSALTSDASPEIRDGAYAAFATSCASQSIQQINDAIRNIEDQDRRASVAREIIMSQSETRPDVAAQLWTTEFNQAPSMSNEKFVVRQLARNIGLWSAKDPEAAASFVHSLNIFSDDSKAVLDAALSRESH